MAKIIVEPDCGNSPRKLFLKDLHVAFAEGDLTMVSGHIPDAIVWEIVGEETINGKEACLAALRNSKSWEVKQLEIDTIITHGPDASVSGKITQKGGVQFAFCDVYRFAGAGGFKLKSITSFMVSLK